MSLIAKIRAFPHIIGIAIAAAQADDYDNAHERPPVELLNLVRSRILGFAGARSLYACIALILLGAAGVAAGSFSPPQVAVVLGSLSGLAWFFAADSLWVSRMPYGIRERLDLRKDRPLLQRRVIAGAIMVVWFGLALAFNIQNGTAGQVSYGSPIMGAATVFFALVAFRIGSATESERLQEDAAYEKWLARQQRKTAGPLRRKRRGFRRREEARDDDED